MQVADALDDRHIDAFVQIAAKQPRLSISSSTPETHRLSVVVSCSSLIDQLQHRLSTHSSV